MWLPIARHTVENGIESQVGRSKEEEEEDLLVDER
jgi:hypothetical protein